MRKQILAEGEHYHVFNRGIDKRSIILELEDSLRFEKCLDLFNNVDPIGSLYELSFRDQAQVKSKLVDLVAYCINPNHFHLILRQKIDKGISKFMMRLIGGYSWYFNNKYKRSGPLFQGPFKAKHITSNEHLVHASAYVNLNNKVHQLGAQGAKLVRSSWGEYTENSCPGICEKEIVLGQFDTKPDYKRYALDTLPSMLAKRPDYKELAEIMME